MSAFLVRVANRSAQRLRTVSLALLLALVVMGCRGHEEVAADVAGSTTSTPSAATPSAAAPATLNPTEVVAQLERLFEGPARDVWYGVYMGARKVGHGHMLYRHSAPGEPGAFAVIVDLEMTLEASGRRSRMTVSERRFYAPAPDLGLVVAEMEMGASGVRDLRRATRATDGLRVTRTLNGEAQPERLLSPSRDNLAFLLATNPIDPDALQVGAHRTVYAWDWEDEADDIVVVTVDKVEARQTAGITSRVAFLSLAYEKSGITMKSQVANGGSVLLMSLGAALTLRQEEEEVARSGVVGLDVVDSGVRVDAKLGDPEQVSRLVLAATVPEGFALPSAPNQLVEPLDGGRVRVTLVRGAGASVAPAEREAALAEDAIVDWRAAPVRELAERLTAGLQTSREKVDALAGWVHDNLDKKLATHLPTASAILERKVGDCTEHTWLFTALARAAGLAARPVYGVAWAGDLDQRFAYHAWAEVDLDGTWWAVDPTWGEPVADATHLQLGFELKRVGAVVGGLALEVIEHTGAP